ncbi:MAG: triacylglycerol lipase [Deltaproteobacteria bacterium]|nr:MAG: triacylglycerol lipase [Deltaproteobacteria bacterium]
MAGVHHIYLIPGFFGFADLGGIPYFHHVREFLRDVLSDVGVDARVTTVATLPTASIRHRAGRLLSTIEADAAEDDAPIHLIGHSTGGLDARLLVTPHVALGADRNVESVATRVRSVISVATPHQGTPLAGFFGSLTGKKALWALSLASIYTLRFGRLPLSVLFRLVGVIAKLDGHLGLRHNVLDQVYRDLLADFDTEREAAIAEFLEHVRSDQSLLRQLTPEGIDLFNASTGDRPGVRYGSVVTWARRPSLRANLDIGLDPYLQATQGLYRALWWMSSRSRAECPLSAAQRAALLDVWGEVPELRDNDGMVPTLAQAWGEIIHAARADHLDVCGHFHDPEHDPPHVDWVATGSGFRRPAFESLWTDVAAFIAGAAQGASPDEA